MLPRHLLILVVLVTAAGCASTPPPEGAGPLDQIAALLPGAARKAKAVDAPGKISRAELQQDVMGFADEYAVAIWQAADEIRRADLPLETRAAAQYLKVLYASAAFRIAAGRRPAANLLDMIVFVTLGRMSVEEYSQPQVYGEAGKPLLASYRRLEQEIWTLAGPVLTPAQQDELRRAIRQWRQAHPGQYHVADVRLSDFARLRGGSLIDAAAHRTTGLVASVEEATRSADEAVLLAERLMFYLERLPNVITLQSDLILDQVAVSPAVKAIVADTGRITRTAEQLADLLERLPGLVATERKAAIAQVTGWLSADQPPLRSLLGDVRQTLASGSELAASVDKTVHSLDAFMAPYQSDTPAAPGPPIDMQDYIRTAQQLTTALTQLDSVIQSFDRLIEQRPLAQRIEQIVAAVDQISAKGERLLVWLFGLTALLVLLIIFGVMLAALIYKYLAALIGGPRSRREKAS